jgi:hypothetical protein
MIFDAIGRTARRVVRYIGFRGAALILFALSYIGIGIGIIGNPQTDSGLVHTMLPIWLRVSLWCGSGLIALAAAVVCPRWQSIGFGVLFLPPAQRALSYAIELVRDLVEHPAGIYVLAGGVLLLCGLVGCVAVATSGEPRRVRVRAAWGIGVGALGLAVLIAWVILTGQLSLRWVSGSAIYSLFCALVMLISAWPEPPPMPRVEERAREKGSL